MIVWLIIFIIAFPYAVYSSVNSKLEKPKEEDGRFKKFNYKYLNFSGAALCFSVYSLTKVVNESFFNIKNDALFNIINSSVVLIIVIVAANIISKIIIKKKRLV